MVQYIMVIFKMLSRVYLRLITGMTNMVASIKCSIYFISSTTTLKILFKIFEVCDILGTLDTVLFCTLQMAYAKNLDQFSHRHE